MTVCKWHEFSLPQLKIIRALPAAVLSCFNLNIDSGTTVSSMIWPSSTWTRVKRVKGLQRRSTRVCYRRGSVLYAPSGSGGSLDCVLLPWLLKGFEVLFLAWLSMCRAAGSIGFSASEMTQGGEKYPKEHRRYCDGLVEDWYTHTTIQRISSFICREMWG